MTIITMIEKNMIILVHHKKLKYWYYPNALINLDIRILFKEGYKKFYSVKKKLKLKFKKGFKKKTCTLEL